MRERRDLATLSVLVVVCLLPFVAKAIHIDDPMYLWAAHQIAANPLDFYGFDVNWYGSFAPMYELNKNPPLVSAYLALVGGIFGWSEPALHAGMMLPALALVLGTYALARHFCASPLVAALATWMTSGVLVSATTLMSDVLMLSLWVWACVFWVWGLESQRGGHWLAAGVLLGLCPLAKYFGLVLAPLLALYAVARERRVGVWAFYLAVPVLMVGAYELYLSWRYGWDALGDVARYAVTFPAKARFSVWERGWVGLFFAGGAFLTAGLFAPWLWSARALIGAGGLVALGIAGVPLLGTFGDLPLVEEGGARWGLALQMGLLAACGISVLALAVLDVRARRDADSLLLALWVLGVWVFCSFTNWTPTTRAILPMAPAVGILIARRLELRLGPSAVNIDGWLRAPLLAGLALALVVGYGDARLAESAREAAQDMARRYGDDARVRFQGAWGFQHYMESLGFERLNLADATLAPGDRIVSPLVSSNRLAFPPDVVRTVEEPEFPASSWVATISKSGGAGFYAAIWGPLPFVFGPNPPERYRVEEVLRPVRLNPGTAPPR